MGYRDQVSEQAKQASENRNGGEEREELEQIDVDFGNTSFVKFTPTTMPEFTFPEGEGNPVILFKNRERLADLGDDATDEEGRDLRLTSTRYLGLVVDNVSAVTDEEDGLDGTIILDTSGNDSTDYRIFNENDSETEVSEVYNADGEVEGTEVSYRTSSYKGEVVDEVPGRAILVVDRTAHVSVARALDVRGGPTAGMDEETGQVNDALIEYFPSDTDYPDNGRYSRPFVELREDLYGTTVGIMVTWRSEVDEQFAEEIEGNDNRSDMMWYSVFNTETGEAVEKGNYGEPVVGSFLIENFDASVGQLPDEDWEFVQEYVAQGAPDDEETILQNIEEHSEALSDDPNTDRMVTLIQAGAGAE